MFFRFIPLCSFWVVLVGAMGGRFGGSTLGSVFGVPILMTHMYICTTKCVIRTDTTRARGI